MVKKSDKDDDLSRWENILADADIKTIPVNFLSEIKIKMLDGTEEVFDIAKLKKKGLKLKEIELLLSEFVDHYDDDIDSMDFVLNIKAVSKVVSRKTKRLLGD